MKYKRQMWYVILALSLIPFAAGIARGQGTTDHAAGQNLREMKFALVPGIPACSTASVQNGNPAKGPSILLAKAETGCTVPWHWHTPNEHLMIVAGVARLEMKDAKPLTLRAGGYALMPSKHVHEFRCTSACVFYVYSDGAFDTHYVDGQGKEISLDDALKAVKQTAPKKTQ